VKFRSSNFGKSDTVRRLEQAQAGFIPPVWTSTLSLHVWHGIGQTIIDNAIDKRCGHLGACVQAKGGCFKQLM